jgi:hypothetical protein
VPAESISLLHNLRALAKARRARGDTSLVLSPVPEAQEHFEPPNAFEGGPEQGLVLEPYEGAAFETCDLARRQANAKINAFCDGIRSTYFIGYEDVHPILYTRNAAAVRKREDKTGYHVSMYGIQRNRSTLLAPFGLFPSSIRTTYERLGLCPDKLADLCWTPPEDDEFGLTPIDMSAMGSLAWQQRALRRARRILDLSEQVATLAGARIVREQDPSESTWLLKDGSLFQFDKVYLRQREPLRNVVSCVKTHPVPFFGVDGERKIAQLEVGQRSVAFLPRPIREAQRKPPRTLVDTARPMVSWYLRASPPNPRNPNKLNGVVRLDMAAVDDWDCWVDEVSWAVLDEFYGISAMPDPRYDVMPYGIYDCEQFLKAQQIPGELLLAQLA